jgi:hypothetical protein
MLSLEMSIRNESWQISFSRGKLSLARHHPESALKSFEAALAACPVEQNKDLARILCYLGVTFNRLGMANCALKSWSAGQKIDKRGYSGKLLKRFANSYGMARQRSEELDDWKAFYSVHLTRYLSMKKSRKLGTEAEKDMIWDLILEGWKELKSAAALHHMSSEEKMKLFVAYKIVFPFFNVPVAGDFEQAIPVDFNRRRRISFEDLCFCGSGLPYSICCGRTPGEDEIINGVI